MNKETEQLKRKFINKFCNESCDENWKECKTHWDKTGFDGWFYRTTPEQVWQFIEKALTNQTTTLKKKVEGIWDKSMACGMLEHGMVLIGHPKKVRKAMMKRIKEKLLEDILKELKQ